jgi:hypothetical protein
VEELTLPKGGYVWDQTFANDTAFYLKGTQNNLDNARTVLDLFYLASRAKINWGKFGPVKKKKTGNGGMR